MASEAIRVLQRFISIPFKLHTVLCTRLIQSLGVVQRFHVLLASKRYEFRPRADVDRCRTRFLQVKHLCLPRLLLIGTLQWTAIT